MQRFEDIIAWQKSRELVKLVYCSFSRCRDYGFRDQIQRAVLSIMNIIAEGFERKGDKELIRFLNIALGSCGEVRSMLYTAEDLNYLSPEQAQNLRLLSQEVRKITLGFAHSVNV